jgi:hypothetical protein
MLAASRRLAAGRRLLAIGALVALVTIGDVVRFDRTLAPLAGPEIATATPRVVELLRADPTWGRSLILPPISIFADWSPPGGWAGNPNGWVEARVYLPADVPQSFGLRTVGGYAGFVDPRHASFFQAATVQALEQGRYDLYSLVGTRYFVVGPQFNLPGLPSADAPPFRVYRNESAFPRAFIVGELLSARDDIEAHKLIVKLSNEGGLRTAAVVVNAPTVRASSWEIVSQEDPRPERVRLETRTDGDALVVLNERWDRGWRVHVDGKPARLLEVDTVLMGAVAPAGEHVVEFSYRPAGLVLGRYVSLVTILACVAATPLLWRRRAREAKPEAAVGLSPRTPTAGLLQWYSTSVDLSSPRER